VARVDPSVVSIVRPDGEGSGVVWSADGVIVTNSHVVEGVDSVAGIAWSTRVIDRSSAGIAGYRRPPAIELE
jgi:serine protease DegQ